MRVAALYDIHGNLPALEAVLTELDLALEGDPPDAIVVGGDVLCGPYQVECIELLRAADAMFLAGNCERDVLHGDSEADRWCRDRLPDDLVADVARWPATIELDVDGLGRVIFCHATPRSDDEIITRLTPDDAVAEAFAGSGADVAVCGHTHVQVDRAVPGGTRLVNAGSVGMPYEGRPGAFWALFGGGGGVQLRTTPYPVAPALARLSEPGFPSVEDVFFEQVRGEITAESASEYFESLRAT